MCERANTHTSLASKPVGDTGFFIVFLSVQRIFTNTICPVLSGDIPHKLKNNPATVYIAASFLKA